MRAKSTKIISNKSISLTLVILWTLFIFTMSLLPGNDSSNISSGFSLWIKSGLDSIFVNNNISVDTLHSVIRKGAHIFEYFVLGISYFYLAKSWKLSILRTLLLGLLTATTDELLQNIPADRVASAVDIFLFDFGGFVLSFISLLLIFNRKKDFLDKKTILEKLANNEISAEKAYKSIYKKTHYIKFTNKAHFLKLSIIVPGEPGVNKFLKVLFFLPIPLGIFKIAIPFINFEKHDIPFSKNELLQIVNAKNISVNVLSSTNEKVNIKTF